MPDDTISEGAGLADLSREVAGNAAAASSDQLLEEDYSGRSTMIGRLRWAADPRLRRHAKTVAASMRLLWHDLIVHGVFDRGGERCQDCGRDYPRWAATDQDWNEVVGVPWGLLCPRCFVERWRAEAEEARGLLYAWVDASDQSLDKWWGTVSAFLARTEPK